MFDPAIREGGLFSTTSSIQNIYWKHSQITIGDVKTSCPPRNAPSDSSVKKGSFNPKRSPALTAAGLLLPAVCYVDNSRLR